MLNELGAPGDHLGLTRAMAASEGVGLSDALRESRLSECAFAEIVTRCRRCDSVAHCARWLDDPGMAASPDCPNRARFRALI